MSLRKAYLRESDAVRRSRTRHESSELQVDEENEREEKQKIAPNKTAE